MADKSLYRELGEARLEVAKQAKTKADWDRLWKETKHPYPFKLGPCWKSCIEYIVDDFAAELGFYVDILGFVPNALGEEYAMFTSPSGEFYFSIVPAKESRATPADAIKLEFMTEDIIQVSEQLKERGIEFIKEPEPESEGSPMLKGTFQTPHGISVNLWGMIEDKQDT